MNRQTVSALQGPLLVLAVILLAALTSNVLVLIGGFGAGDGPVDFEIWLLGFPWYLVFQEVGRQLPWLESVFDSWWWVYVVIEVLPFALDAAIVVVWIGIRLHRIRRYGISRPFENPLRIGPAR